MVLFAILERRREYRETYGVIGTSVIVLHNEYLDDAGNTKVLDYEGLGKIAGKIEHVSKVFVKHVNPEYRSVVTLLGDGNTPKASSKTGVTGVNSAYSKFRGFTMKEGRFFQDVDESRLVAVISEDFARVLGSEVGDRVRLLGKEFEIIGVIARPKPRLLGIGTDMESIEDVFIPVEILRQEAERYFATEKVWPSVMPRVRVYLIHGLPTSDVIVGQAQKLLEARFGRGNDYLIGQATTAYGYIHFLALVFVTGLVFLFGICLVLYVRSLTAFYSLSYTRNAPIRGTCILLIAAGTGGVLVAAALSHLLMVTPVPLIVPAFLSLVFALPLQLFLMKRTLKYMQISTG
ncbi:MAG: ABC transporter permease [Dethiobacter sp.]|nr:ABC transporter permease [Dethiobacter sp.]